MTIHHSSNINKDKEERLFLNYRKSILYKQAHGDSVYNPFQHLRVDGSVDFEMRKYFFDNKTFKYRPYKNIDEVFKYLSNEEFIENGLEVYVNEDIYIFKDKKLIITT